MTLGFKRSSVKVLRQLIERRQQELGEFFQDACEELGLLPEQIENAKQAIVGQGSESALARLLGIDTEELLRIVASDRGYLEDSQNGFSS